MNKKWIVPIAVIIVVVSAIVVYKNNHGFPSPLPLPMATEGSMGMGTGGGMAVGSSMGGKSFSFNTVEMDQVAPSSRVMATPPVSDGGVMMKEEVGVKPGSKQMVTGSLSIQTDDISSSIDEVKNIAKKQEGQVANLNYNAGKYSSATLTINVPKDKFEDLVDDLSKIGRKLLSSSTNAIDVTEEYVDNETRLKNLQAQEDQYLALMTKSGNISDIIQVTSKLDEVRMQKESILGRQKYLDNRTDYSVVQVSLSTDPKVDNPGDIRWKPIDTIKQQFKNFLGSLVNFGNFLIALVFFIPTLLLWLIVAGIAGWILVKIVKYLKSRIQ